MEVTNALMVRKGKIVYQCTSCDELVRVDDPNQKPGEDPAG